VHRDMKPENVLMDKDGTRVVVTDFGLAFNKDQQYIMTEAGSLPFVAPECWKKKYSVAVDVWAMGCILYAMCTRRASGSNTRTMFSDSLKEGFYEEIRHEMRMYSEELVDLICAMLERDPNHRPTAQEVMVVCIDLNAKATPPCPTERGSTQPNSQSFSGFLRRSPSPGPRHIGNGMRAVGSTENLNEHEPLIRTGTASAATPRTASSGNSSRYSLYMDATTTH
jgi:serine/threonine protein kinase